MVTITWDPPVDGHHDRYYLGYQRADGTGFMDAVLSGTSTEFILDGLEANQNYQFGLFSRVLPDTDSDLPQITFIPLGELKYLSQGVCLFVCFFNHYQACWFLS